SSRVSRRKGRPRGAPPRPARRSRSPLSARQLDQAHHDPGGRSRAGCFSFCEALILAPRRPPHTQIHFGPNSIQTRLLATLLTDRTRTTSPFERTPTSFRFCQPFRMLNSIGPSRALTSPVAMTRSPSFGTPLSFPFVNLKEFSVH